MRFIDTLPTKARKQIREWSARGGRAARGEVKARAARIGWQHSPNRFEKRRERRLAAMPSGFMCECGKWHDYPLGMPYRAIHSCSCGKDHTITRGIAVLRKRKVKV